MCGFVFLGVISLSRSVYGKANSIIPMVISAQDGGGLVSLVNARVNISVVAGLLAPPVFEQTQYYFSVSEDVLRGTVVGIVKAAIKTGRVHKHVPPSLALRAVLTRHMRHPEVTLLLSAQLVQIGLSRYKLPTLKGSSSKKKDHFTLVYIFIFSFKALLQPQK